MITLGSLRTVLVTLALGSNLTTVAAQSVTSGSLRGTVVDERGVGVSDATVSIERDGTAFRTLATDRTGRFVVLHIAPGRYAVLAEQIGFQPVRAAQVLVVAGAESRLTLSMPRRPPPITAVESINPAVSRIGGASGRALQGRESFGFDRFRDITDISRGASEVDAPRDSRPGFVTSASGLGPAFSRLVVDGVEERLLAHPAFAAMPAQAPAFDRDGMDGASIVPFAVDAEWRGAQGATLIGQTAAGRGPTFFRPFARLSSASAGGSSRDNPADSSGTSMQLGVAMGGAIKGDTAGWHLQLGYQRLAQPTGAAFAGSLASETGDPVEDLRSAAGSNVGPFLSPVVRRMDGLSGTGRLDWQLGAAGAIAVRVGGASWTNDNPLVARTASNGAGTRVEGSDVSASAALTTVGETWMNEARTGFSSATRDWTGSGVAGATFAASGIVLGDAPGVAGRFTERAFELNDAVTIRAGAHAFKVGGVAQRRVHTFDYVGGTTGRFDFGSVPGSAGADGFFEQSVRGSDPEPLGISEFGGFLEDLWSATRDITVLVGVRVERERLPIGIGVANPRWGVLTGINTGVDPISKTVIAPRGSVSWDLSGTGRTVFRGGLGVAPGRFDVMSLAEVRAGDGSVMIRRADGSLPWSPSGVTGATRPTLALFGPDVRRPRSFKADAAIEQSLGATRVTVGGSYHHADYLLQRTDLNRPAAAVATGVGGRPIFGSLQQYGAVVGAATGSNRRFDEFDAVFALTSTGFVDYYDATLAIDRAVEHGVSIRASYTWSQTRDNLPGQLGSRTADRLSPFPDGLDGGSWDEGASDFDVPHRLAAMIGYRNDGRISIDVAARGRYRSGLPFTPGYRVGVDVNGDGSAGNDPAYLGASIPGMTELLGAHSCLASQRDGLASRNSCREDAVQSLDLHASIGLPLGLRRRIALEIDAFNVATTESGIIDRAALLIDPAGLITFDNTGNVVLPVTANPGFGAVLSRRNDPRLLRIGIRVEN